MKENKIPIYCMGKRVGVVVNNVFMKTVSGSKHFLVAPPSIANSIEVLQSAAKAGASTAQVFDKETGMTYTASFKSIWQKGFVIERGFGKQIALTMEFWNVIKPDDYEQDAML